MNPLRSDKTHAPDVQACHQLMQAGRFQDAFARISSVKKTAPDDIDVNTAYGAAALGVEDWEAANHAQAFVDRMPTPDAARVLDYWAKMLAMHLRFGVAKHICEQMLTLEPDRLEHYAFYCSICASGGEHLAARERAEECVRRFPANASAWEVAASVFTSGGGEERKMAKQFAGKALELDPKSIPAIKAMGELQPEAVTQDQVATIKQFIEDSRRGAAERAPYAFVLGDILNQRQAFAEAFEAYRAANALLRTHYDAIGARYSESLAKTRIDFIKSYGGRIKGAAFDEAVLIVRPIFIVGLPRSGKTLLQTALCLHERIGAIDESPIGPMLAENIFGAMKNQGAVALDVRVMEFFNHYVEKLKAASPDAGWVIDTTGENVWGLGVLKMIFPQAKFIRVTRNPDDARLEMFFRRLSQSHPYSTDLSEIHSYQNKHENAASLWRDFYGEDFLDISFDSVIANPQKTIADALVWLGLEPDAVSAYAAEGAMVLTGDGRELRVLQTGIGKSKSYGEFV